MMQLQEPLPRTAYAALQLLKATLGAAAFKTSPQDRTGTHAHYPTRKRSVVTRFSSTCRVASRWDLAARIAPGRSHNARARTI